MRSADPPPEITESDLQLVAAIAKRVAGETGGAVEPGDLMAWGTFGIMDAKSKFEPNSQVPFEAYARVRIRGAILDGMRQFKPGTRRETPEFSVLEDIAVEGNQIELAERKELLREVIGHARSLPTKQRSVIVQYYLGGMDMPSIAEAMGVSVSHVSRIHANGIDRIKARILRARIAYGTPPS